MTNAVQRNVEKIWTHLALPAHALASPTLPAHPVPISSSFKIDELAQTSIALSTLTAALYSSATSPNPSTPSRIPKVTVHRRKAYAEFFSERLYTLDGTGPSFTGTIGGLHATRNGHVRIHDGFPHHVAGAVRLLGCEEGAGRTEVAKAALQWDAVELESAAAEAGVPIYALRSTTDWDMLPQAKALPDLPILITKICDGAPPASPGPNAPPYQGGCLSGVRVLELSRVIAAPVAGRTLAAHGADVLWVTSPSLPDLPPVDRELGRGKRTIQLDLNKQADQEKVLELARDADVFIQSYRPGSLAARRLTPEALSAQSRRGGIVYADLSAFGSQGPWAGRRGFDSLVQTCSGMNVAEAEWHHQLDISSNHPAVPMPCQALDHGAGYMLATGIIAALYKRVVDGGSYRVEVSLAGVMKYLRGLGRYEAVKGQRVVIGGEYKTLEDVEEELAMVAEERESGFGVYRHIKHSAVVEGRRVGWDVMPKPLGSDAPEWR